jgi:hypothetical protein
MPTLSQLVATIAATEGIDAERVTAIARAIREQDLIKTSGRGISAAQMSEPDGANLLIAVNTADTARTAPAAVVQYRALQAKWRKQTTEFGSELEELISAAKHGVLADYITKTVARLGTRGHILGRRRFPNEAYRLDIEFEKPVSSVLFGIGVQGDYIVIDFRDRRQTAADTTADRKERTRITQRTILAVAGVLRS